MRKLFKTIVSVILSITFIISYLNVITNDVSAASGSMVEGQTYTCPSDNYSYEFSPVQTGYYFLESTAWADVYCTTYGYEDHIDSVNFIPIGLDPVISEDSIREVYYMEYRQTYSLHFNKGDQFIIRRADKYVQLGLSSREVMASLDQPIRLSIYPYLSDYLELDSDITYEWCDIPNNPGYTTSSIQLNLSQLLDEDYNFIYDYGYCEYDSDFGMGFVSCLVSAVYQGKTYETYVTFKIIGYYSSLSMYCSAEGGGEYCVNYHEAIDFESPLFEVSAYCEYSDASISYQWYKKDPTKAYTGIFDLDKKYYTKLNGYNTKKVYMSEAFLEAIGEPYFDVYDQNCLNLRTDLVCAVTYTLEDKTYVKVIDHTLYFMLQVIQNFTTSITAVKGETVVLPRDGKFFDEDGEFTETDMPAGITYKYTWYDCKAIVDDEGTIAMGEEVDCSDLIANATLLGTGKTKSINTSTLTALDTPTGKVSYVLCTVEPYYNGKKVFSPNFVNGYFVFDIHYCDITINSQPVSYTGPVGSTAKFTVNAEGEGLTYQWQLKKGSSWTNLTSGGATTSTLSFKVDESKNGKIYRCLITDSNGNTISTNLVDITVIESTLMITSEPSDFTGLVGSSAVFSVAAEGEGLTYQWQLKKGNSWANLSTGGAKTATMTIKVDDSKNGKVYRCLITDSYGVSVTTKEVSITVEEPPITITTQPKNFVGPVGSTAKFSVAAEGEGLTYQWQLKKGKSWANLTSGGATTTTMSVKVDESRDGKIYRCLITNVEGKEVATNEVSITINADSISITTQPKNYSGPEGSTAKFTIAAQGEGLTYQWQLKKGKSWANLTSGGATTNTLSFKVDESKNGKVYRCVITNAAGNEVASDEVSITVKNPDITITSQPTSVNGKIGTNAVFKVVAQGEGLTYQWQLKKGKSWADLSTGGAKTSTMTIKIDSGKDGKVYRCLITNAAGEQLATEEVKITVDSSSASGGVIELPFVPADELDNTTAEQASVEPAPAAEVTEPAVEEPAPEVPAAEPAPEAPADDAPVTDEAV